MAGTGEDVEHVADAARIRIGEVEGAPVEAKPEKFLKPVRLVLDFEVVDYREQAAK